MITKFKIWGLVNVYIYITRKVPFQCFYSKNQHDSNVILSYHNNYNHKMLQNNVIYE